MTVDDEPLILLVRKIGFWTLIHPICFQKVVRLFAFAIFTTIGFSGTIEFAMLYGSQQCRSTGDCPRVHSCRRAEPLISTTSVDKGKLAGAIKKRVRERGRAVIHSVGAVAVNEALKSIAVANEYIQNDRDSFRGLLVVSPTFMRTPLPVRSTFTATTDSVVMALTVHNMKLPRSRDSMDNFIRATTDDARVAQLASAIKLRVMEVGMTRLAVMGAAGVYRALKSIMSATNFLQQDMGNSNVSIVASPCFERIQVDDKEYTRVVLTCVRRGG